MKVEHIETEHPLIWLMYAMVIVAACAISALFPFGWFS